MSHAALQELIVPLLLAQSSDRLVDLWDRVKQPDAAPLLVFHQAQPIGLLRVLQLSSWLQAIAAEHLAPPDISLAEAWQQAADGWQTWLEPVQILPLSSAIEALYPHLATIDRQQWVMQASDGSWGLIDRLKLLQRVSIQALTATSADHHLRSFSTSNWDGLNLTLELLEQLPLPLMLQTDNGSTLGQNRLWREQVENLQNPSQVRQEAAGFLESIANQTRSAGSNPWLELSPSLASVQAEEDTDPEPDSWYAVMNAIDQPAVCHPGNEPDTCVCFCAMKDGQTRLWQFLKIPVQLTPTARYPQTPGTPFRLGTLNPIDPMETSQAASNRLWLIVAQDVTEQAQITRELAAKNADLTQLNRLKDEFLACISHELRTPLTAILGLSSLLGDQTLGKLNDRQARYVNLIHRGGRRLMLIVNDILDLTRIESGQLALHVKPVTIESVCQRAYQQAQQLYSDHTTDETPAIQFQIVIQPGLTGLIADEMRLCQMLGNLLSNALKFTETGGEIRIVVEQWEDWIAFTVCDTGIGIPIEKQHLIFQKFQQLESPFTRRFEGTGLELVLTQRLARLHGGEVTFTSIEGEGSQFTLLLPPQPPQPAVSSHRAASGSRRLVLIVEAAPEPLRALSEQVTALGYRSAIARSGTEAIEKARRLQPGIILLGALLPVLSGWDVLTLLKADHSTRQIPVMMTSGSAAVEQARHGGAAHCFSLPIALETLRDYLERYLAAPPATADLASPLTVLYLRAALEPEVMPAIADPAHLLHPHQCRVLEVDDLDQAELLAKVWQPDVVLLDGHLPSSISYMQQLSQHSTLAALPLITLTTSMTEAANQVAGLTIFPCLITTQSHLLPEAQTAALLQVMLLAAGKLWTPHVLIAAPNLVIQPSPLDRSTPAGSVLALVQYLQVAGLDCSLETQWSKVLPQLQQQSLDLLLLHLPPRLDIALFQSIAADLKQLPQPPPILVWQTQPIEPSPELSQILQAFQQIAIQDLPPAVPALALLNRIQQLLKPR